MYKESLPVSSGRMRNRSMSDSNVVIVEEKKQPFVNNNLQDAVANNLPQIIEIAKSVVSLKEIEVKTNAQIAILQEQQRSLLVEADKFVKEESERRKTFEKRGDNALKTLQELRMTLSEAAISDEVKREVIELFSKQLERVMRED